MRNLKRARVAVALLFFALTAFLFLDVTELARPALMNDVTFLQFLPSLMKFVNTAGLAAGGFLVVLLLTVLFGRVYCSTICPLGTLQDAVAFLARKLRKKHYQRRMPRFDRTRFGLLALTAVTLAAGSTLLTNLLDPFSSAGRILANLARPLVLGTNNLLAFALESLRVYLLYPVEPYIPPLAAAVTSVLILGVVAWLAFTRGRLYCNMICPVGALLGLVSRAAVWKVTIDENDCTGCGLCERVCKGGCIDRKARTVDFDRCVGCFNCFDACPRGDMRFTTPWRRKQTPAPVNRGRRRLVQNAAGAFLLLGALPEQAKKKIVPTKATTVRTGSARAVTPPGSRGQEHFNATCTACHLCVSACPTRVLQPALFEYGVMGILQPRMDYQLSSCNYDCVLCGQVCPSGAILPLALDDKKLTQLGIAKFVKDNCVVNTEHTDCGACSEHCPTKAVRMVPFEGKLVIPEVRNDLCIGCGSCEHACPTRPWRAIYVEANSLHALAKKPEQKQAEPAPAPVEDFPF